MTVPMRPLPEMRHIGSSPLKDRLWVVFASDGRLRSGWCALLFVAIYLALSTALEMVLARFLQVAANTPLSPGQVVAQESCDLVAIFGSAWIMARLEGRSISSFGYRDERVARRLAWGAFFGIVSLTGLVGILWRAHLLIFSGLSTTGIIAWKYAFEWAFAALLVGVLEGRSAASRVSPIHTFTGFRLLANCVPALDSVRALAFR